MSKDRKAAARRWFDRRAERYERGIGSKWLAGMQRQALDALALAPDDVVLDVGCGPGAAVRDASPIVARVVGIDLSPEMIRRAQEASPGLANVEFRVADSENIPFEDAEFTAVLCSTSFHHYPHPQIAVREMARVLRPGGRLVLADASADLPAARVADFFLRRFEPGHVRLHRTEELASFLYGAGLAEVRVRRLSSGGYSIVRGIRPA